jgi:ubiquinone/menaquinone biosynthesis C-methylase UbiE
MAYNSLLRITTLRDGYDTRAPTYDSEHGFHERQAADYQKWMKVEPGYKILDLACGTGNIVLPAAQAAGPPGTVIAVDVSPASLAIAKAKAKERGLNVKFLEHDVGNLDELESEGVTEGTFDVITCASAFVLLENSQAVVKGWAKYLKPLGRLIFDTLTADSMIQGLTIEKVGQKMGVDIILSRVYMDTEEKIRGLLTGAGLDASEMFTTGPYIDPPEQFHVSKAGEMFDDMVDGEKWYHHWYTKLAEPGVREKARELYIKEIEALADEKGIVTGGLRFYIAIGRKV